MDKAYFVEYRKKNAVRLREKQRAWRAANPDKVKAQNARRPDRDKRWRATNPAAAKAAADRWYAKNKGRRNAITAARTARKKALSPPLTAAEKQRVNEVYVVARRLTELTGLAYHVDHIKPLAKGGLHHPDNLQVLRGVLNQSKGAKYAE